MSNHEEHPAVDDLFARRQARDGRRAAIPEPAAPVQVSKEPQPTPEYHALMASGVWRYEVAGPRSLRIWTRSDTNWFSEEVAHRILVGLTPDPAERSRSSRKDSPSSSPPNLYLVS